MGWCANRPLGVRQLPLAATTLTAVPAAVNAREKQPSGREFGMREIDWFAWHTLYDDPTSKRAKRLSRMQSAVLQALISHGPGSIDLLSVCAGQGREIVGALEQFPRPADVAVTTIELDPRNAGYARAAVERAGAGRVESIVADAGLRTHYTGGRAYDVLLLCGVFGNLVLSDIERTADLAAAVVRPGGRVVWTRHRGSPDRVPVIASWFEARGFVPEHMNDPADSIAVAVHRMDGPTRPLPAGDRMFTFVSGVVPAGPLPQPA
jgi:hypothetical protein